MKKLFLVAFLSLGSLGSSAEVRYQSIDNIRDTNIVLVDKDAPDKVEITDAVFYNDGKEYQAKQIRCDLRNGVATYKLKFRRFTVFKNCKIVLTVNGEKITVDVQKGMSDR